MTIICYVDLFQLQQITPNLSFCFVYICESKKSVLEVIIYDIDVEKQKPFILK